MHDQRSPRVHVPAVRRPNSANDGLQHLTLRRRIPLGLGRERPKSPLRGRRISRRRDPVVHACRKLCRTKLSRHFVTLVTLQARCLTENIFLERRNPILKACRLLDPSSSFPHDALLSEAGASALASPAMVCSHEDRRHNLGYAQNKLGENCMDGTQLAVLGERWRRACLRSRRSLRLSALRTPLRNRPTPLATRGDQQDVKPVPATTNKKCRELLIAHAAPKAKIWTPAQRRLCGAARRAALPALRSSSRDDLPSRTACSNPEATLVRRVVSDRGTSPQTSSSTARSTAAVSPSSIAASLPSSTKLYRTAMRPDTFSSMLRCGLNSNLRS